MCLKLGFLLVHNPEGVLSAALLGTLFNKYIVVRSEYIHKYLGNDVLFIILLTISIKVRLRLLAIPFCCVFQGILHINPDIVPLHYIINNILHLYLTLLILFFYLTVFQLHKYIPQGHSLRIIFYAAYKYIFIA